MPATLGLYWNQADSVERQVVLDAAGRLQAALGPRSVPLKSLGAGAFVMTAAPGARISFEEKPDGAVHLKPAPTGPFLIRMEPFKPSAEQLAEDQVLYRSDEMDAVFRISLKDGGLQLVRTKQRPAAIDPMFKDSFRSPNGVIQFSRDPAGRVSKFLLEGGRVRHLKFWKDTSAPRPGRD